MTYDIIPLSELAERWGVTPKTATKCLKKAGVATVTAVSLLDVEQLERNPTITVTELASRWRVTGATICSAVLRGDVQTDDTRGRARITLQSVERLEAQLAEHVTVAELAQRWNTPASTLYADISAGRMPSVKLLGRVRVPLAWIEDKEAPGLTDEARRVYRAARGKTG